MDLSVLDQVTGDETLVKARVVVPGHEDLHWDRQCGEPVDECPELGLVPVGIEVVRGVPAVHNDVDPTGDLKLTVEPVCVAQVPNFKLTHVSSTFLIIIIYSKVGLHACLHD